MSKFIVTFDHYCQVPSPAIKDKRLSLATLGMYTFICNLSKDWEFSVAGLAEAKGVGVKAVNNAIKALEEAGYLLRVQRRKANKFAGYDYIVLADPTMKPYIQSSFSPKSYNDDKDNAKVVIRPKASNIKPNNIRPNNIKHKQQQVVPVDNSDDVVARCVDSFVAVGCAAEEARGLIEQYGVQRVQEVLSAAQRPGIDSPVGWARAALAHQWSVSPHRPEGEPRDKKEKNYAAQQSVADAIVLYMRQRGNPYWSAAQFAATGYLLVADANNEESKMVTLSRAMEIGDIAETDLAPYMVVAGTSEPPNGLEGVG